MEKKKTPFSIKVIYWITNITFWIYVGVGVLAVGLAIAMFANLFGDDLQLHVGVPTEFNVLEQGLLTIHDQIINVELKNAVGKIHFIDTPPFLAKIYASFMLIIMVLFFFIFKTFRKFITNVKKGIYFDITNISLLKRIAYMLIGVWGFTVFYSIFQFFFVMNRIQFDSIDTSLNIQFYPSILLVALFIWVLSHIFVKGCKLQEETKLTI